jgi:hypothetical protein
VVPSGSSGATGRKSAPSPVEAEESSSSSEEEEEEEEEEEAGAAARLKVYVRGHSILAERPILPTNRPIIRPKGAQ